HDFNHQIMVLEISTVGILSTSSRPRENAEYGVITIHCSEVEDDKGYIQLRVLDRPPSDPYPEAPTKAHHIPVRSEAGIFTISDRDYEICAIYGQEDPGDGKIEVIFLYPASDQKDEVSQPLTVAKRSEFCFSRPGLVMSLALKQFNQ
ncbi:MAG: hypothetical protein AAGA85_16865, partial [Bacteroidota bacterium]